MVGLLRHLDIAQADIFGFSVGGAYHIHLAIKHPQLVRKLVVSSVSFHPAGDRPENSEAVDALTVDAIVGTPMEEDYRAKSPNSDKLQDLLDKLGRFDAGFTGWADADIEGIAAPTLLTVGDWSPFGSTTWSGSCSCVVATSTATSWVSRPRSWRCSRGPPISSGSPRPSSSWERCCPSSMPLCPKLDP